MMTKEEYQKTLIRMWDKSRTDTIYVGLKGCDSVNCKQCCLEAFCRNPYDAFEMIDAVEKWAKEHSIETNGSIYLKAFPNANVCGYEDNGKILHIRLDNSKPSNADGNMIKVPAEWWNKEVE